MTLLPAKLPDRRFMFSCYGDGLPADLWDYFCPVHFILFVHFIHLNPLISVYTGSLCSSFWNNASYIHIFVLVWGSCK